MSDSCEHHFLFHSKDAFLMEFSPCIENVLVYKCCKCGETDTRHEPVAQGYHNYIF